MNPMQELAIKYPTLWEHIAKGGKVRGYDSSPKDGLCGELQKIEADDGNRLYFYINTNDGGSNWYQIIELLPLPKRVSTKDLGKAVNWFDWHSAQCILRDERGDIYYNYYGTRVYYTMIRQVVIFRQDPPDWWPEELMEDEE